MTRIGSPLRPAAAPATAPTSAPAKPSGAPKPGAAVAGFVGSGGLSPADLPAAGAPGAGLQARLSAVLEARGAHRAAGDMRPGVAELYEAYGVEQRFGRPRERVLSWAAFIHDFISAQDKGGISKAMVDKDLRRQVFLLEGILKLYRKEYPELRPVFDEAKKLEDMLGHYKEPRDQLEAMAGTRAPPEALAVLEKKAVDTERQLEAYVAERWTPDAKGRIPAIATLVKTLEGADWASERDDRAFLVRALRTELKGILETPYDMGELQGDVGMHELRRDLRWFPIYIESLDGLVQLDDTRNPLQAYEPLLETDLARSKFLRLPDASLDKDPILLSKSLYAANMQAVLAFGGLKDEREAIEGLAHAMTDAGLAAPGAESETLAAKALGRAADGDAKLVAQGRVLFEELQKNKLVKALRDDLKEYR
jgi:hypothetical protein